MRNAIPSSAAHTLCGHEVRPPHAAAQVQQGHEVLVMPKSNLGENKAANSAKKLPDPGQMQPSAAMLAAMMRCARKRITLVTSATRNKASLDNP
jgi:hypothetical protein